MRAGRGVALPHAVSESMKVAVRIEKSSQSGKTTVYLIGHFQSEHVEELKKQLRENGPRFVLDLKEVTFVDVDVVRFLETCRAQLFSHQARRRRAAQESASASDAERGCLPG
jgi:hypothetical protein